MPRSIPLMLAALLAAAVPARSAEPPAQHVEGRVDVATRGEGSLVAQTLNDDAGLNGQVAYVFAVDPGVRGGTFSLAVTGGDTGEEDLDIEWYRESGSIFSLDFGEIGGSATRGAGGEAGFVPRAAVTGVVTLHSGARATFTFDAVGPDEDTEPGPVLPQPGIHPEFGRSDDAAAATLRGRSHVVIAVVDTGINPYHVSYRRPEYVVHPSLYIDGFPSDAPALGLSLDEDEYATARNADDAPVWSKVQDTKLYWVPGTNIIGAYSREKDLGSATPRTIRNAPRPIIDDQGHGTMTSSLAGSSFAPNPDVLIVSVEDIGDRALEWAVSQPWIDFVSLSWGDPNSIPFNDSTPQTGKILEPVADDIEPIWSETELSSREYAYTGPFVMRDGRTACQAAGNGQFVVPWTSFSTQAGPSWVATIGASHSRNNQSHSWHSVPLDVISPGIGEPRADAFSTDGIEPGSGTSAAAPFACSLWSKALLQARRALGDTREGIHEVSGRRVPAAGSPASGMLADGILTRRELQDAVLKTAFPYEFDPSTYGTSRTIPTTDYYYVYQGYGVLDAKSVGRAVKVIVGEQNLPERADVDRWIALMDQVRDTFWDPERYDEPTEPPQGLP